GQRTCWRAGRSAGRGRCCAGRWSRGSSGAGSSRSPRRRQPELRRVVPVAVLLGPDAAVRNAVAAAAVLRERHAREEEAAEEDEGDDDAGPTRALGSGPALLQRTAVLVLLAAAARAGGVPSGQLWSLIRWGISRGSQYNG